MKVQGISNATVARLPIYADRLTRLSEQGVAVVSSASLAKAAGVTAAQLRKDLSYLGFFGVRGRGYDVQDLHCQIARLLGYDRNWSVAIVGYGKLGSALARYRGFARENFHIVAAFDVDPGKIGRDDSIEVYPIENIDRVVSEKAVDMAIITTPLFVAQWVADRLISAGVKSILNFAPVQLVVPDDVMLREVDLAREMQILAFFETWRDGDNALRAVRGPQVQSSQNRSETRGDRRVRSGQFAPEVRRGI